MKPSLYHFRSFAGVGLQWLASRRAILRLTVQDMKFDYGNNKTRVLQSEKFFIYRALQKECLDPEYFFYTWPEKKVIYIEVPKCASSYTLSLIGKARHGVDFEAGNPHDQDQIGLPGPYQLGVVRFLNIALDPEACIFTIVRNPYDRVVSCYLDKFAEASIGDGSQYSKLIIRWWRLRDRVPPFGRAITFEEFCVFAQETASIGFDGHWALQSKIIPLKILEPNIIGKFENAAEDLPEILKRIGVGNEIAELAIARSKPPRVTDSRTFYTSKMRSIISETYMEDFIRFGYQP